jgi:alpha-L-arabinofuranosidase
MTSLERNGDVVKMASYAPMLAKKGFTQWKTDMIFFDNVHLCPTTNYYVQKLFSLNRGDFYFDHVVAKEANDTAVATSCVKDSRTGDVIVKIVNTGKDAKAIKIDLSAFKSIMPEATQTLLSGEGDAENTFENPGNVTPVVSTVEVKRKFTYESPAMSLTVIRLKNAD